MEQANQDPQNHIDSAKRTLVACALASAASLGLSATYAFSTDIGRIQADEHAIEVMRDNHVAGQAIDAVQADVNEHQDHIIYDFEYNGGMLGLSGLAVAYGAASIARRRREEQSGDDQHRGERSE